MKKYLIIFLVLFLSVGIYFISGFALDRFNSEDENTVYLPEDTIKNYNGGVAPEVVAPEYKKSCKENSDCCKCRCKNKCTHKDTTIHTGDVEEVPVGENPYINNPDTAKNKIRPQEEK